MAREYITNKHCLCVVVACKKCGYKMEFEVERVENFINHEIDGDATSHCAKCDAITQWSKEELADMVDESEW